MPEQVRPPIVTILGHVDHGKTTLLDFIRKSSVAAHEHGGITQAIGAYQAVVDGRLITFIDTPGHAAFEKMRSRGAKVADIAVLVVAVDDGVMPQTVEAIKHIREAKIPMIVAINKIDIPGLNLPAQVEKTKRQLSSSQVLVEEYGGDVPLVSLSAKTGQDVEKLLEMILLVAEVNEIKGDPSLPAQGVVIEANMDKNKGPVATVVIRDGTLKKGGVVKVGGAQGKIRTLLDSTGKQLDSAGPSTPVEILGLSAVPTVGSVLGEEVEPAPKAQVLSLIDKLRQEGSEGLNIVIKADKAGSLEAIEDAVSSLSSESETVKIVSKGTGDISENDVELAAATKALIVGFNIKISPQVGKLAETERVLVRTYSIIYELIEELKDVAAGMLAGELREEILGVAQIVAEFPFGKNGRIAGCKVLEGTISKGPKTRVVRGDQVIGEVRIKSIKHLKEEVAKAEQGQDCGLMFEPTIDFQVGDFAQSFRTL